MASDPPPSRITSPPPPRKLLHNSSVSSHSASGTRAARDTRATRRAVKGPASLLGSAQESRETLSASLKQETERKEQLQVQLQNKDQVIANLGNDNDGLMFSLNAAESRLNELYADQARMEEELSARIGVIDKLRAQTRELEKEKRDIQRRYNEQTFTFEAERQAFYDNEQHLKSRIQSLTQARKRTKEPLVQSTDPEPEEIFQPSEPSEPSTARKQDMNDPESEPAEMTALRLELSTLSTSYNSLQSTLHLLQTQLVDLKRVNHQLQEENESYMILLREKTLSGQFDLRKQVGGTLSIPSGPDDDVVAGDDDVGSLRSTGRNTLDRVEESAEEEEDAIPYPAETHSVDSRRRHPAWHTRKSGSVSHSPNRAPRGESLADLPVAGPGLDLAAELGRAENKDIDPGPSIDERTTPSKERRKKSSTDQRKVSSSDSYDLVATSNDIDALRMEVKSLKDANKALSLYASKIIDRIIAEEGFEHVLAVDYEKSQKTPLAATSTHKPPLLGNTAKPRPQSTIFGRAPSTTSTPDSTPALPTSPPTMMKAQRRSLSLDWKTFSMFVGRDKKAENLALPKPGASSVPGARKLETYEDEEDRRERERLKATMKLLGIEKPDPSPDIASSANFPVAVPMEKSFSAPTNPTETAAPQPSRFSIFRSRSATGASDAPSTQPAVSPGLTQGALEQVEAVNALAALDARERTLSEEIAKGGSGGFTEPSTSSLSEEWRSRKSRRSGGGSGSTVWSAGLSRTDYDTDDHPSSVEIPP